MRQCAVKNRGGNCARRRRGRYAKDDDDVNLGYANGSLEKTPLLMTEKMASSKGPAWRISRR